MRRGGKENIVPVYLTLLVAYRGWTGASNRGWGREKIVFQKSITVRYRRFSSTWRDRMWKRCDHHTTRDHGLILDFGDFRFQARQSHGGRGAQQYSLSEHKRDESLTSHTELFSSSVCGIRISWTLVRTGRIFTCPQTITSTDRTHRRTANLATLGLRTGVAVARSRFKALSIGPGVPDAMIASHPISFSVTPLHQCSTAAHPPAHHPYL